MKLTKSKNSNPNYLAKIVKVESFTPHPNADRLKLATVDGCVISVSKDTEPGIFIYFPVECQINQEYLSNNNMFREKTLNKDPEQSGFFEDTRRVKCIKLRGLASEGLIMPIRSLIENQAEGLPSNIENLVGTEFDTLDDVLFVNKYIPKQSRTPGAPGSRQRNKEKQYEELIMENQFRFHPDTEQLKKNLFKFKTDTQIHISHKFHGTSAIFCNLLVKKKLSIYQKFLNLIGADVVKTEYKTFCSSRKVVKDPEINKGLQNGYYKYDIWNLALEVIKEHIQKGMTVYAEIVGYMPDGSMIQKDYDYGCEYDPKLKYSDMTPQEMYDANLFRIYIYRITYTNVEGKVFEMSARNLQQYCRSRGLFSVIEDFYGTVYDFTTYLCNNPHEVNLDPEVESGPFEEHFLKCLISRYLERPCGWCNNKVPAEGIVVRIDQPEFEAYKLKSLAFLTHETKMLDEGVADIESEQSEDN